MSKLNDRASSAFDGVQDDPSDYIFQAPPAKSAGVPRRVDPNALVPVEGGGYRFRDFLLSPTALVIPDDATDDDLIELGYVVQALESSSSWLAGDYANYMIAQKDQTLEGIAEAFGFEVETLYTYAWVARNVPTSIRNRSLSFSHHRAVASLSENGLKQAWLEKAAIENLNVKELKKAMRPALLPAKTVDMSLFSNEKRPKTTGLKGLASRAGKGDDAARDELLERLQAFRAWCNAVEDSINR